MKETGSMWNSSPRGRRAIGDLSAIINPPDVPHEHSHFPVALILGAGVDTNLSGEIARPPWTRLISKLAMSCGIDGIRNNALKQLASSWPLEAAEALRCFAGPVAYGNAIREFVSTKVELNKNNLYESLRNLIKNRVRLVINFNYTPDVLNILRDIDKKTRVIDRYHLGAWNHYQLLFPPSDTIHIIHLHGFIDPGIADFPSVVLDRKSYDEITLSSTYYNKLLRRLFQDFTVITVGLSWTDFFLRNAAAEIRYEFPIAMRTHYALLKHDNPAKDMWLERGLISSYSVRSLYYKEYTEVGDVIKSIEELRPPNKELALSRKKADIIELADRLDQLGDYESGMQSDWMASNWSDVKEMIEERIVNITSDELSLEFWLAFARIERHLRHFLWFYLDPDPKVRSETRRSIWEKIANRYSEINDDDREFFLLSNIKRLDQLKYFKPENRVKFDIRGFFEYAIGAYEVFYGLDNHQMSSISLDWRNMLESFQKKAPRSIIGRRIQLARIIWQKLPPQKDLEKLRNDASICGWESLEAKIVLDQLQAEFLQRRPKSNKLPREWGNKQRQKIITLSEDAYSVARNAGCLRREVGSVILGSFVDSLPKAERNLIAIYERFVENGGRSKDIAMIWWIFIGLLAVYYDKRMKKRINNIFIKEAIDWIELRCSKIVLPESRVIDALKQNSFKHWKGFHRQATLLAEGILNKISNNAK